MHRRSLFFLLPPCRQRLPEAFGLLYVTANNFGNDMFQQTCVYPNYLRMLSLLLRRRANAEIVTSQSKLMCLLSTRPQDLTLLDNAVFLF